MYIELNACERKSQNRLNLNITVYVVKAVKIFSNAIPVNH